MTSIFQGFVPDRSASHFFVFYLRGGGGCFVTDYFLRISDHHEINTEDVTSDVYTELP